MKQNVTKENIISAIETLCKALNGKEIVGLMTELYWGLTDSEKDKFLAETENS